MAALIAAGSLLTPRSTDAAGPVRWRRLSRFAVSASVDAHHHALRGQTLRQGQRVSAERRLTRPIFQRWRSEPAAAVVVVVGQFATRLSAARCGRRCWRARHAMSFPTRARRAQLSLRSSRPSGQGGRLADLPDWADAETIEAVTMHWPGSAGWPRPII